MKYTFFILFIITALISCKPILSGIYGINKDISFQSLNEYKNFITSRFEINVNQLYLIEPTHYNSFMDWVIQNKVDYFAGIFLDDSTQIRKSEHLLQNQSCTGRVLAEIKNAETLTPVATQQSMPLKTFSFYNAVTKEPLTFTDNNRKKIVLVFSYKSGTLNKKDFKEVQALVEAKPGFELWIISLDQVPSG